MRKFLSQKLIDLALCLNSPLFVVGGFTRNFLIDGTLSKDIDLSGAIRDEELLEGIKKVGLNVIAEYKRTGTVVFSDGNIKYEFTAFRREKYKGGEHTPYETEFTTNIKEDALRRDFKCNAVYYDIKNAKFVDPLCGIKDIENKILDTVDEPKKVFSHDGLRLMRLARFAGELNFTPTEKVIEGATIYAENIKEISAERIYAELVKMLVADGAYPFSDTKGHYTSLKILDKTRVLDYILPELTDGRDMVQRADFHRYDVLEHSLRCVLYAEKEVRLGALLHDIGKPFCFRRDGYYYHHFSEGEKIAEHVLKRLKADANAIEQVKFLVKEHMVDLDCSVKESKVRLFIVKNQKRLEQLMCVKQADFRASLETHDVAPTLIKWDRIYKKMRLDGTPFTLKELKITAKELMDLGYEGERLGKELNKLWGSVVVNPQKNDKKLLLEMAKKDLTIK